jgi:hypothetical protein
VGKDTVAVLLKELGFALRVNHKKVSSGRYTTPAAKEKRNSQFEYIKQLKEDFLRQGAPCIYVDAKKKELVGLFKNSGKTWKKEPVGCSDHDFRSQAKGRVTPYGIYNSEGNKGFVVVGTSYNTPEFAVDSIVQWWETEGRWEYSRTKKILILADSGGSNGCRSRVWKYELFHKLGRRYGLEVTVAHYPPGTSKWNQIDHRLFSEISKNWQGVPLRDHETILKYIRTTTTSTGLKVKAYLNEKVYRLGKKVTAKQMKRVGIVQHETNPEWNYTLNPGKTIHTQFQKQKKKGIQREMWKEVVKVMERSRESVNLVKSLIAAAQTSKM